MRPLHEVAKVGSRPIKRCWLQASTIVGVVAGLVMLGGVSQASAAIMDVTYTGTVSSVDRHKHTNCDNNGQREKRKTIDKASGKTLAQFVMLKIFNEI
jgi:hypothetical protein